MRHLTFRAQNMYDILTLCDNVDNEPERVRKGSPEQTSLYAGKIITE